MTSMADCIANGIRAGDVTPVRANQALKVYNDLYARYSTIMSPGQAAARAAADMKKATAAAKRARYHKVVNQLQAMRRIAAAIETAPDPAAALKGLLVYAEGSGYRGESVRSLTEAYVGSINAGIREALEKTGRNLVGESRNKPLLQDLIRELHNEATGNAEAKAIAQAIRAQQQRMRRLFNAHGGDIGELADYGVPHSHDGDALIRAGRAAWKAKIAPLLAWDRIPDLTTGQPFAARAGQVPPASVTDRFLDEVYAGITTRGWDNRDPSLSTGGRALYNTRAEHRVLHFRDGRAWLEYNRDFGTGDPFTAMVSGLHGLAEDVALMRVLGPNPRQGLDFAIQTAQARAARAGNAAMQAAVTKAGKRALTMLAMQTGASNVPENIAAARFLSGTRAVLTATQLGSAVISSVTDVATISAAAHVVGMNPRNVLSRSVELLASQATRETAARMGYVAETLADAGGGVSRWFGQAFGTGLPERMSGFVLRATGLSAVTDMRKIAFQMEFAGHLADHADRALADLPQGLRVAMENRGITARDWDLLRDPATRFRAPNGADFISPIWWLEHQTALPRTEAEGLAMRMQAMMREQLEFAIPTASLEGRAMMLGETRPGTIGGELLRSSTMYKSFALSLMLGQYRRFASASQYGVNKWAYAATLSTMLLLTGALAIQLKELVKGNDPRPMDTGKFWMAALFQGGGLGIFGDFFNAETSRAGGGIAETIAGPVVGLGSDILKPVASNVTRAINGQETLLGRDAANFVRGNTPFLSSAWYTRAAYSRLVADNLAAFLDPEAEILARRRLRQQQKDYGTQPWLAPFGAGIRAPDLTNAFGGQP